MDICIKIYEQIYSVTEILNKQYHMTNNTK
jgi:hypothetical protein